MLKYLGYLYLTDVLFSDMTYVLGFGSLWGALRIADVLPWDLDIDIRE